MIQIVLNKIVKNLFTLKFVYGLLVLVRAERTLPESITDGSKSTKTALGTCRPDPVDEKKVENESSVAETESAPMVPSGLIPCSMQ